MKLTTDVKIDPKALAAEFWNMESDEQALFYQELFKLAGSHNLVLQGLHIREGCKTLSPEALDGFQYLSTCAFQWFDCYEREGMLG